MTEFTATTESESPPLTLDTLRRAIAEIPQRHPSPPIYMVHASMAMPESDKDGDPLFYRYHHHPNALMPGSEPCIMTRHGRNLILLARALRKSGSTLRRVGRGGGIARNYRIIPRAQP